MMGLRTFHLLFITISIAMAVVFGAWAVREFALQGGLINLFWMTLAFGGAAGLVVYEIKVVKKFKSAHIE